MKHTTWAWALGLALWLCASLLSAAPKSSGGEAERTSLYQEGVKLAEQGRWREAAEKFEQVVAIRSAPRARFTLGEAQEKSGKLGSAKATYTLALEEARSAGDKEAAAAAGAGLAAIERRVPKLILHFAEPVDDVRVSVDGRSVELSDGSLDLDPGEHELVIRAPGHQPFERQVDASEGRTTELTVQLEPKSDGGGATDGGEEADEADSSGTPAGAWVLGATGIAATGVGLALYFTGQSAYDEAEEQCLNADCSQRGNADDANAARSQMIVGDVLMAVGAGAVVGAVIWLAVAASQSPDDEEQDQQARVWFSIGPTHDGLGLSVGGTL